jgi:hypothetical protein
VRITGLAREEIIGTRSPATRAPAATTPVLQEAATEEHLAWTTTRRFKPDTLAQFERGPCGPGTHPDGMPRAFAYWSDDEQQVIGVAFGASK